MECLSTFINEEADNLQERIRFCKQGLTTIEKDHIQRIERARNLKCSSLYNYNKIKLFNISLIELLSGERLSLISDLTSP